MVMYRGRIGLMTFRPCRPFGTMSARRFTSRYMREMEVFPPDDETDLPSRPPPGGPTRWHWRLIATGSMTAMMQSNRFTQKRVPQSPVSEETEISRAQRAP